MINVGDVNPFLSYLRETQPIFQTRKRKKKKSKSILNMNNRSKVICEDVFGNFSHCIKDDKRWQEES